MRKTIISIFFFRRLPLFAAAMLSSALAFGQAKPAEDTKQWWEYRDTSRFTPTGYFAGSFGFVDDGNKSFNPAFFLSFAKPVNNSFMGITARIGYNSIPAGVPATWFTQYYIAAGPLATIQLNERYAFDVRLLGGLMYCKYPEQLYLNNTTTSNNGNPVERDSTVYYTLDIQSSNTYAFFFQAGLGFRFQFTKSTGLIFNVDYMGLRADFNTTITTYQNGSSVTQHNNVTGTTTQPQFYHYTTNPVSFPITYEPTDMHHNGYTIFTLGLYYRLGQPVLIK